MPSRQVQHPSSQDPPHGRNIQGRASDQCPEDRDPDIRNCRRQLDATFAIVNACVNLRRNNFDPLVIFFPKLTHSKILTPSFSHTAVRCGYPTLRQIVSTWTRCGGRLAPRRANEGYTAEPAALARLVCQAYHRRKGSYALPPPMPPLAHSGCQQSRACRP